MAKLSQEAIEDSVPAIPGFCSLYQYGVLLFGNRVMRSAGVDIDRDLERDPMFLQLSYMLLMR